MKEAGWERMKNTEFARDFVSARNTFVYGVDEAMSGEINPDRRW
jgi:hypothetical protein